MATSSSSDTSRAGIDEGVPFAPESQLANVLGLCEAQMESALHESDQAVAALIEAFTGLVEATRSVSTLSKQLPPQVRQALGGDFEQQFAAISKEMSAAVMAFQFYDKLTQRLGHVRYSLSALALFVCDRSKAAQPQQWDRLLGTLRRLYRTEEERQIFHMIMDCAESEPAASDPLLADAAKAGEVELF